MAEARESIMSKITGMEAAQNVPPKVLLIYKAIEQLIAEGQDLNVLKVSTITDLAGIGKGTAYDYFETKDEMIACALLYQIKNISGLLSEALMKQESFSAQINFLLDSIEKENGKQQYFLRFVHVLTENSGYCQLARAKMATEQFQNFIPKNVFAELAIRGMERGEIRKDLPADYVVCAVFSKMMTYLISFCSAECFDLNPVQFRPYIYQGLVDELCEKNV